MRSGTLRSGGSPELSEPMKGFDVTEDKRTAFLEKQKKFKKAWRKQVSNFEFATSDTEAIAATDAMYKVLACWAAVCPRRPALAT